MVTPEPPKARYSQLFAVAEFRAVFAAHVISMLGEVVAAVALTVLIYEKTGSPILAALTFTAAFLPYLFGGALLSSVVDRLPARAVLVGCNLASAVLVGVMALFTLPVGALLGLLFVLGLIAPVFSGVRAATLSDILGQGPAFILGRSVIRLVAQFSQIVGSLAGGLVLLILSPRATLAADAASFACSALLLRLGTKRRPRKVLASELSLLRDSLAGLKEVFAQPWLGRLFALGWLLPACTAAPEALAAPYTHGIGLAAAAVGIYLAGLPAGAALGDLVVARVASARTQRRLVVPGALLTCLPLVAFIWHPGLPVALALLFVAGLGCAYIPGYDQLLLATSDDRLRGRTLAAYTAGLMFAQGVGFAFWGMVAEFLSPQLVIPIAAACGIVTIVVWRPRVR
jgi:MFS family permease